MRTLPPSELKRLFHATMTEPAHWSVVRYELDIDYTTGLPECLVLMFRSHSGMQRRLRFVKPTMQDFGPLQIPTSSNLYVADLSSLGWESGQQIEVGELDEEHSVLFRAQSVEEIA